MTRTPVKISFFGFFPKVSILGLHDLHSANINMRIAVILSLSLSLEALQKLRYEFPTYAPNMKYGRGSTGLGLARQHVPLGDLSYQ